MNFEQYYEKHKKPLYGVMKNFGSFFKAYGEDFRMDILSEGVIKLGELYSAEIHDEKIIYYRLLDHIDNFVTKRIHFSSIPVEFSSYQMMSYRSLIKKESDIKLWTLEWIMEQEYRGKFSRQRAELMLEIARLNMGGFNYIGGKFEKEDYEFMSPQIIVNFTSNIEFDWLDEFCRTEDDKKILQAILKDGVYTNKKISDYLGYEKVGKVKYFLNRLKKEFLEQGITAEKFRELHMQNDTPKGRAVGITAE